MNYSKIIIKDVNLSGNRIVYNYEIHGPVKAYFNLDNLMFVEYSQEISGVPEGLAVIPLLTNILPIAWLSDSEIYVQQIDRSFFESIENFKRGFIDMFPNLEFKGRLVADNIVDCRYELNEKTATFFSGGVDSTSTLITRLAEQPDLITIWGSDLLFNHICGWNKVKNFVEQTAARFNLDAIFIKSNFRSFIDYGCLNKDFGQRLGDNWWHGIQHGIGLIGHVAPLSFLHHYRTLYIPASLSEKDLNNYGQRVVLASFPTIDNQVRFGSTVVIHEGFHLNRQDKIKNICNFVKKTNTRMGLRVCWKSKAGDNCGKCEKCARTIMGILSEGMDPNDFNFKITRKDLQRISFKIRKEWFLTGNEITHWLAIKDNFLKNINGLKKQNEIKWILNYDFRQVNSSLGKKIRRKTKHFRRRLGQLVKGARKSMLKNLLHR